jgi:hypothetical protein
MGAKRALVNFGESVWGALFFLIEAKALPRSNVIYSIPARRGLLYVLVRKFTMAIIRVKVYYTITFHQISILE